MKTLPSILGYLLFVILLAVPPVVLQYTGNGDLMVPQFWLVFFYISGLTFMVISAVVLMNAKNKEYFVQAYLAGTTVKILACIIFIFIFAMKNKVNKHVFLADFFYIYLLNMVFEVYVLLRNLRHKNLR
jgi:hypothetical protein